MRDSARPEDVLIHNEQHDVTGRKAFRLVSAPLLTRLFIRCNLFPCFRSQLEFFTQFRRCWTRLYCSTIPALRKTQEESGCVLLLREWWEAFAVALFWTKHTDSSAYLRVFTQQLILRLTRLTLFQRNDTRSLHVYDDRNVYLHVHHEHWLHFRRLSDVIPARVLHDGVSASGLRVRRRADVSRTRRDIVGHSQCGRTSFRNPFHAVILGNFGLVWWYCCQFAYGRLSCRWHSDNRSH